MDPSFCTYISIWRCTMLFCNSILFRDRTNCWTSFGPPVLMPKYCLVCLYKRIICVTFTILNTIFIYSEIVRTNKIWNNRKSILHTYHHAKRMWIISHPLAVLYVVWFNLRSCLCGISHWTKTSFVVITINVVWFNSITTVAFSKSNSCTHNCLQICKISYVKPKFIPASHLSNF